MKQWILFLLNNKELARITAAECFYGEIKETRSLLAYENNCNIEDITIKLITA